MARSIIKESNLTCSGCGACFTVCPASAISLQDVGGFQKAEVSESLCTDCGKCAAACPRLDNSSHNPSDLEDSAIYACWHQDDAIRLSSTSGGVGDLIASTFLNLGYKIVGAVYDYETHTIRHKIIERIDDLPAIRGSKYLQSRTHEAFSQLSGDERYVIFGTPCQINGIRKSMGKRLDPDKVILVDFFCHGVPSMLLWQKYLAYIKKHHGISTIEEIRFRDKSTGWHNYSMRISGNGRTYSRSMRDDLFYNFYLSDICLNKGCYSCTLGHESIASDIRMGDFWGPKFREDKKGVSLIMVNTPAGQKVLEAIKEQLTLIPATEKELLEAQPILTKPVPAVYEAVITDLKSDMDLKAIFNRYLRAAYIKRRLVLALKSLFPRQLKAMIKKLLRR
jgi:coenzyme F420-reducing hydrogenase beta subunit